MHTCSCCRCAALLHPPLFVTIWESVGCCGLCVCVCVRTHEWSAASHKGVIVGERGPEGRQAVWLVKTIVSHFAHSPCHWGCHYGGSLTCSPSPSLPPPLPHTLTSQRSSEDLRYSQKHSDRAMKMFLRKLQNLPCRHQSPSTRHIFSHPLTIVCRHFTCDMWRDTLRCPHSICHDKQKKTYMKYTLIHEMHG